MADLAVTHSSAETLNFFWSYHRLQMAGELPDALGRGIIRVVVL
jgi:hypothetical protein